ncbi:MAG: translation initiation factor IF-2 subunit gamma [Thermoplasmata archaeon HGW-Thermoplasmata-1]|nr:MAG: translation initiation factor IF-2 subunit gamma [Thermoplasmata archaeon HGW-Thermoplasmata-1]
MPRQPEVNIGMIGHVDHGKTTLTKALSGKWTDEHSEELKRGISIKLGYADTAFYKCPTCGSPECYTFSHKCPKCGSECELLRVVSFVDAPGHETLMAIMLSGAAIMDGALLLVAANEKCPQPQTKEHLMALDIVGAKNIVIVQNKLDLVSEEKAYQNYLEIKQFVEGTCAEDAPIIPISAHHDVNIDTLVEAIQQIIPTPQRDPGAAPLLYCARSFDINKPGTSPDKLTGGIIGGSLIQGTLKVGEEIEICPGRKVESHGKVFYEPITTKITSIFSGGKSLKSANPGGLLAIGTSLDPSITKADGVAGRVIGRPGTLPPMREGFTMEVHLLERVVGAAEEESVEPIKMREPLMLTIGTATTVGVVNNTKPDSVEVKLKLPVCASDGQRVAISRRVGGRWRLIGYGIVSA